jgi:hypothetical protein
MMKRTLAAFVLLVSSPAFGDEHPRQEHVYRLDFVVSENEAGKAATSSSYTLNLVEHTAGQIKMGTNVALPGGSPGSTMRVDVGLFLRARFSSVGDDLLVESDVEISAAKDAQNIRKLSAKGNAQVIPGKPALLASVEEPMSHKRYQITVAATKLR